MCIRSWVCVLGVPDARLSVREEAFRALFREVREVLSSMAGGLEVLPGQFFVCRIKTLFRPRGLLSGVSCRNRGLGALTEEEILRHGSVGAAVYLEYIKGAGGWLRCSLVLLSLALANSILVLANLWLSYWSDHSSGKRRSARSLGTLPSAVRERSLPSSSSFSPFSPISFLFRDVTEEEVSLVKGYFIYTALALTNLTVAMVGYTAVARSAQTAARYFHDRLLRKITE